MYRVGVRDHVMIAHSFRGELFGPAQRLHGATYVVDAEFAGEQLAKEGVLLDIGRAAAALQRVLAEFAYRNLDELQALADHNTTTEFVAKLIFDRLAARIAAGELGPGSEGLRSLKVVLRESHVAWASFESDLARSDPRPTP
jgi:6-pyruvoyltetrahydropterin/6-carboxytetrahydropterin synthase